MQTLSFSQRLMETCTTELPTCTETKDVNLFASDINCNHDVSSIGRPNKSNVYRVDDNIFSSNAAECYEQENNEELEEQSEETYNLSMMPNRSQMHLRKEQEVHLTPRRATNHLLHSTASTIRANDKEHEHKHRQLFFNNESKEDDVSSFSEEKTNEVEQNEEEEELGREQTKYKSSFECLENDVQNHNLFTYKAWPYLQNTLPQSLQMCDMYNSHVPMTNRSKKLSSRVRYHSERYGNFIRAYLKWSEDESRKACLKARNVSAVGIVRATRNKSALIAASSSATTTTTNATSIAACDHINTRNNNDNSCNNGSKINASKVSKTIMSTRYTCCAYKTSRPFRRHTALAVEGDALFAELIEYAHECFERKTSMAEHIYTNKCKKWELHIAGAANEEVEKDVIGSSDNTEEECEQESSYCKKQKTEQQEEYEEYQRELSKFTPNARCIAIHYGISKSSTPYSSHSCNNSFMEKYVQLSSSHYPRASLMAIIATTRLEKNTVIVVDIPSYYRCLNEGEWYRHVYSTSWHNRYSTLGRSNNNNRTEQHNVWNDNTCKCDYHHHHHHHHSKDSVVKEEKKEHEQWKLLSEKDDAIVDDVCTGVKVFARWPESVPFYHGVGEMHSTSELNRVNSTTLHKSIKSNSTVERNEKTRHKAIASFPFTLIDLEHTPELGSNQMGLAAAMFIPYATCFLYTGPVMSTQQTERLLNYKNVNAETIKCNKREHCQKESVCEGSNEVHSCVHDDKCINGNDKEADVLDDTYALGLDNDNICFGQGLSRYINHRYNINRFGNCELCTILLSLPSSVVKSKQEGRLQKVTLSKTQKKKRAKQPTLQHIRECDEVENNNNEFSCANKENLVSETCEYEQEEYEEEQYVDSDHNNTITNTETHIPCNSACMLTIPFFLTTTDIYAGHSLLAWTYGEDYDAKLERIAVADHQIVPYCDSVLLNSRANHRDYCNCLSNNISNDDDNISRMRNFEMKSEKQRYGGDYRFALSTGDIVWRRRPRCTSTFAVKHFPQTSELQSKQYYQYEEEEEEEETLEESQEERVAKCKLHNIEMHFDPEKYSDSVGITFAHPQYDLFQVMGVMKNGMEYLLLREIKPYHWSNGSSSNDKELNVYGYNSEWSNFAKEHELECIAANHIANDFNASEECNSYSQDSIERHVQTNVDEWAFYRLHHAGNYKLAAELDKCVVASSDLVGLLLSGIDYHITHTAHKGNTWCGLTCAPHFIIYLPHLIHATSLVNNALVTCTQIEPEPSSLWSGLVWPLLEKSNSPHTIDEMLSIYCESSEGDIRSERSDYWSDDSYSDDEGDNEIEQISNSSEGANMNEKSRKRSN